MGSEIIVTFVSSFSGTRDSRPDFPLFFPPRQQITQTDGLKIQSMTIKSGSGFRSWNRRWSDSHFEHMRRYILCLTLSCLFFDLMLMKTDRWMKWPFVCESDGEEGEEN